MMSSSQIPPFDPDFAQPYEWAAMYRAVGLQVVPARYPMLTREDKRPKLASWKEFQHALVSDTIFSSWFSRDAKPNMGLITGQASDNVIVVDLDEHTHEPARLWFQGICLIHNFSLEPETWTQITGGGGRQLFFRAPPGWHAPTNRTPIGVDIRGQGGFAMLPPSIHLSGRAYEWAPGLAPWEIEIAEAPPWLLDAIDDLVDQYGGDNGSTSGGERTPSPSTDYNAFGARIDGREDALAKWVWRTVVELHRATGGVLPADQGKAAFEESLAHWLRTAKTRIPGVENAVGLERECRGASAFLVKWQRAIKKWDTLIAQHAGEPRPGAGTYSGTNGTGGGSSGSNGSYDPNDFADTGTERARGEGGQLVITADEFVKGFTPPDYLIDGMLQRGYLYSATARTGHGKTAVAMFCGACVSRGLAIGRRGVKQGSVLFLAGENPDDIRARLLVLAEAMAFKPRDVPLHFVAGVVNIAASMPAIREAAERIGDLVLVIVDTAAAYFLGDDANSNTQQGGFARQLRELSFLPGKPAVLVCCHPVKNAAKDNLTPMGGSAFLNEVDGNLTLWSGVEGQTTLHWQGKFRGPEFEPLTFKLRTETSPKVIDSDGVLIPSIVAEPMNDLEVEAGKRQQESEENKLLAVLGANPKASIRELALKVGFVGVNGEAQKSKTQRLLQKLTTWKLAEQDREDHYRITAKGRKELGWDGD